jgi:DNA-binding MarR family transcriptional regulator
MQSDDVVDLLQRVVLGSVAMTVSAIVQATGGHELTFTQWRAILVVGERDDGGRVGEVAERVHGTLPATSRLLRRLERRGLLSLERDEQDRRATRARLSPEGRRIRAAVLGHRREQLAAIAATVRPPRAAEDTLRALATEFERAAR